jgi:nucleoside 2-deoxyribosyltransferase
MWFDKSIDPAWKAIEAGIRNAGYEPLRIDRKEHNNKIDDEIVAGIRRSKFLVADFTNHRGGVYFEAGLAMGLGLPVIWLCRQDDLEHAHFDTRQYNHIPWEIGKLDELSKSLKNRIEATIGTGPLQPVT